MASNKTGNQAQAKIDPEKEAQIAKLQEEKDAIGTTYPNAARLLAEEIDRVQTGRELNKLIEVHQPKPTKLAVKVLIPVKQFPKFNFVGKLLGPKGNSLKRLQEDTGSKMAILGRGSMRDRAKEEECRKEGGKFAHLNDDLHVMVEVFGLPVETHQRMANSLIELQRFLVPDNNDEIRQQQFEEMMFMNGDKPGPNGPPSGPPRGRGRGRGAAPPRGRGGVGALLATPPSRNAPPPPPSRGAPGRGGPRAAPVGRAPPPGRAAPMSRPPSMPGRPAPASRSMESSYDQDPYYGQSSGGGYSEDNYGYEESHDYADPYAQSYSAQSSQETEYYDYGHGGSGTEESYGDGWNQGNSAYGKVPAPRPDRPAMAQRSHPYSAGAPRTARY